MKTPAKWIGSASLATLVALYVVGAVSHGSLRHEVQTLPLWVPIVLGFRERELAKWAALPCMAIWLVLMSLIWLFLLGWAHVISGSFSPIEIGMTIVVGVSSVVGIIAGFRWKTSVSILFATGMVILFAVLQVAALRISLLPGIANQ